MMKIIIAILVVLLPMLISGCSSPAKYRPSQPYLAGIKLSEAATTATHSLDNLAQIEQAIHPSAKILPPPNPDTYGMGMKASVDWYGPIQQVVSRVAAMTGYRFVILGRAPAIPILVTVVEHNKPLGEILQDIGYQAEKHADVVVFPASRTVELRYAKT